MKRVLIVLCLFLVARAQAQENLFANESHVVTLFFPSPIRQAVTGAEHFTFSYNREEAQHFGLLQAHKGSDSNLLVITRDGRAYAYGLEYRRQLPETYRFVSVHESIGKETETKVLPIPIVADTIPKTQESRDIHPEKELMARGAEYLLKKKGGTLRTKRKDGLKLRLKELFHYGDKVYVELEIQNNSAIDFEVDVLEIYIVNGKKGKRSSHQKVLLEPKLKYSFPKIIRVGQRQSFVHVVPKFTLGDGQRLLFELHEKKGNRMLRLSHK